MKDAIHYRSARGFPEIKSTNIAFPKTQYQSLALTWHSVSEKREYKQTQWCHPSLLLGPMLARIRKSSETIGDNDFF